MYFFHIFFIAGVSIRSLTISSVVGAPWRCGVLTTLGGIAGILLGRLLGRGHASTRQSGVEAPRLFKRSLPRLYYCCCCWCWCWVGVVVGGGGGGGRGGGGVVVVIVVGVVVRSFVRSVVRQVSGVVFALCATPNTCSRDSANTLSFFVTSQGAISPAVSTRGQSRPLAFESVWL